MKLVPLMIAAAAAALPLEAPAAAQTAGDPAMGQKQFSQCKACHTTGPAGKDGIGPNLAGVYGTKAATRRAKFKYSPALKASGLTWDDPTLDRWLMDPSTTVKGTTMHFIGLPRKPARQNVIAYIKTLK